MAYRYDDIGNGQRFVDFWGDEVRWVDDIGQWYVWHAEEGRWVCSLEDVHQMGKLVVESMYDEALQLEAQGDADGAAALVSWSKQTAGLTRFRAMLHMASTTPQIRMKVADFDRGVYFLNCKENIWDLRTGTVYEGDRASLLMTKQAASEPAKGGWRGGLWERFLNFVLPNENIRRYLQDVCGYAAFFGVEERLMLFLHGGTGRGKSKFIEALAGALGDYAVSVPVGAFLSESRSGDQYSLARLPGARFVSASEFDEKAKINVSLIKSLTSSEPMTVRMIRGKPFDYVPGGTIFISTNHMPFFGDDKAAWARVRKIPFDVELGWAGDLFGTADLTVSLGSPDCRQEILAWIIEGAVRYWNRVPVGGSKLVPPPEIMEATADEVESQKHIVMQMLEEMFDGDTDVFQSVSDIYWVFRHWCSERGIGEREMLKQDWVSRKMQANGVIKRRAAEARCLGVGRIRHDTMSPGLVSLMGLEGGIRVRLEAGWKKRGESGVTPGWK